MNLPFLCVVALIGSAIADGSSDNRKPTPQIITEDGYSVQVYDLTTQDGYSIQIHRIPGTGKPVLIIHGLLGSSADWVISGPGKALAYLLADFGYDVWLGNARGNTYSKNQTNMTSSAREDYWNFSWHEMGYYDLPTVIDFALATTGQEKLFYIGFSQGTTSFYVLTCMRPEYNEKIIAMFAMAPIAYVNHATNILARLASLADFLLLFGLVDGTEFLPNEAFIALLAGSSCTDGALTQDVCGNAFMAIFPMSQGQLNETQLPIILGHVPAGASTRQILHYGYLGHCNCFSHYDYGFAGNLVVYHSLSPPEYDLSKITAPVYSYCGAADTLSAEEDVDRLISEIRNPMKKTIVSNPNWAHVDFIYGVDARTEVYDDIIQIMQTNYGS